MRLRSRVARLNNRLGHWGPLIGGFVALALVFVFGLVGYMRVEDWSFFDSLYQVVITLSTVGFQEVYPLSRNGRILTMVLIVSGVGAFAYLVGSFTQVLVEGRLPVTEVSLASGFESPCSFARAFRARFGVSASEYRLMHARPAHAGVRS